MKHIFYSLLAAFGLLCVTASCSDNEDEIYAPTGAKKTLTYTVTAEGTGASYNATDHKLDFGAAPDKAEVSITSNTRWKAVVKNCPEGWCTIDPASGGNGDGFTITVRDNMREKRQCDIDFYVVDALGNETDLSEVSIPSITVTQEVSNVRLSPSSLEPFPAYTETVSPKDFSITANDVAWTLTVDYESEEDGSFVKISPVKGMNDDGNGVFSGSTDATFTLSLDNNRAAAGRRATLTLRSDVGTYPVEIMQQGSDYVFEVSPSETQRISDAGDVLKFGVLSLSDWTVATAAEVTWVRFSKQSGQASSSTTEIEVTFAPNPTNEERTARLVFTPTNSNYRGMTVTVIQQASPVTLTVSPSGELNAGPEGGVFGFDINSFSGWSISSTAGWITFDQREGSAGMHSVAATITPNPSAGDRTAVILIQNGSQTIEVPVSQSAYDMYFSVSSTDSQIVMSDASTLEYTVNTAFSWEVNVPEWITPDIGDPYQMGNGRIQIPVAIEISENHANMERTGFIEFIPHTTIRNNVELNPASWGIEPIRISITQYGGREPAVSVPWLDDGYTQHEADVLFRYYSPFWPVTGAGIEWRVAGSDSWSDHTAQVGDEHDGLVRVSLTGLDSATEYQTRGYVEYTDGNGVTQRKYGNWTFPFTTAGIYPENGDNPTPGTR